MKKSDNLSGWVGRRRKETRKGEMAQGRIDRREKFLNRMELAEVRKWHG